MTNEIHLMSWFIRELESCSGRAKEPRSPKVKRLIQLSREYPNFPVMELARMAKMKHQTAHVSLKRWCPEYVFQGRGRPSSK